MLHEGSIQIPSLRNSAQESKRLSDFSQFALCSSPNTICSAPHRLQSSCRCSPWEASFEEVDIAVSQAPYVPLRSLASSKVLTNWLAVITPFPTLTSRTGRNS